MTEKTPRNQLRFIITASLASFSKGFAIGIGLGVAYWLQALIIESDSAVVLLIKNMLLPIGTMFLFYHIVNKLLAKANLAASLTSKAGRVVAVITGVVGFHIGIILYIFVHVRATDFYQASIGTGNEGMLDVLFYFSFIAIVLLIYKVLKL